MPQKLTPTLIRNPQIPARRLPSHPMLRNRLSVPDILRCSLAARTFLLVALDVGIGWAFSICLREAGRCVSGIDSLL